jgi:L-ascorbate metabolism protein UlaG (beta-lactamase superfamily)
MDAAEALGLARDAGIASVVPMHYDLMDGNLGDPDELARLAPDAHPGGRVTVLDRMAATPLATLVSR